MRPLARIAGLPVCLVLAASPPARAAEPSGGASREYAGPREAAQEGSAAGAGSTQAVGAGEEPFEDMGDADGPGMTRATELVRTGAGLTVVGGLLGIGALFLFVLDPCEPEPGNDCRETPRRNASLATGVPAAAMAVAGLSVLTAGLVKRRRLRMGVAAGTTGFAVSLRGSF